MGWNSDQLFKLWLLGHWILLQEPIFPFLSKLNQNDCFHKNVSMIAEELRPDSALLQQQTVSCLLQIFNRRRRTSHNSYHDLESVGNDLSPSRAMSRFSSPKINKSFVKMCPGFEICLWDLNDKMEVNGIQHVVLAALTCQISTFIFKAPSLNTAEATNLWWLFPSACAL